MRQRLIYWIFQRGKNCKHCPYGVSITTYAGQTCWHRTKERKTTERREREHEKL